VLAVAALLLDLLAAAQPARVESLYALALYPRLAALACVSAALPFPVAEALAATLLVLSFGAVVRRMRAERLVLGAATLIADLALVLAAGWLSFLVLWGLNYRRVPLAAAAGLDARGGTVAELEALALELADAANAVRDGLAEGPDGTLRPGDRVLERAGGGRACARVKAPFVSPLLSRLGLSGLFVPFTFEPLVNGDAPAPELPFAAAHERAHLAGRAREDEASFAAYLACRAHPDADFRYSGHLIAGLHVESALASLDRVRWAAVARRHGPAVRRDLDLMRRWSQRHEGPARRASERVNDAYLRSRGQAGGIASYGRVVDLLLAERRARLAGAAPRAAE
jgi:hypothetical protein